ncbi:hypothetical protein AURDEDRAFT_128301 [Auricularia subglabra TFB-10046 SS5]|nr:hypothetical protein AURDEDRAFT_128301 [Auricularia subglabra TFB-10046 SS5]
MKFSLAAFTLAALATVANACTCSHSGDAARWIDSHSPRNAAALIINGSAAGTGCYRATVQGNMCIHTIGGISNDAVQICMAQEAAADQSYHGDWFLWNVITCEAAGATLQLTITG